MRQGRQSQVDAELWPKHLSGVRIWFVILIAVFFFQPPPDAAAQSEPVRGFVTVDPFEIRVEAICMPKFFQEAWSLEEPLLAGKEKEKVLQNALESLMRGTAVETPYEEFYFDSTQIQFIRLNPDLGYVPDDREVIPLREALVGVSISSPRGSN